MTVTTLENDKIYHVSHYNFYLELKWGGGSKMMPQYLLTVFDRCMCTIIGINNMPTLISNNLKTCSFLQYNRIST